MRLIIASNNKNKIREIKEILGDKFEEIVSMREAGGFVHRQCTQKSGGNSETLPAGCRACG